MQSLEQHLGYTFQDRTLLQKALTHPSAKLSTDNQRLEFLGDAVLEFCVSDLLYRKYPDCQEGELTARRASLVCEETLSLLARELGLGPALKMGHGEDLTMGREKPSILADALEAVLAAIHLDGGVEAAKQVISRLFQNEERLSAQKGRDEKGLLQELTQARDMGLPEYQITQESGPAHDRRFQAQVLIQGKPLAAGQGASKKAAEQAAARAALEALEGRGEGPGDGRGSAPAPRQG